MVNSLTIEHFAGLRKKYPGGTYILERMRTSQSAFTLPELLVVIAMVAVLSVILWPVLARGNEQAVDMGAFVNMRQLAGAWHMYSADNQGALPPNRNGERYPSWVAGQMRGDSQNTAAPSINAAPYIGVEDYTNTALLLDPGFSVMGSYVRDPKVFKDPGDQSTWADPGGAAYPRVRSFSMNCAMDTDFKDDGDWTGGGGTATTPSDWRHYGNERDLVAPSPSALWVFLDEHPDSINDGLFDLAMPAAPADTQFIDMPSSYHNNACPFSFADGHAEYHQWIYPGAFPPIIWQVQEVSLPVRTQSVAPPDNPDFLWVAAHTTAPAPNAPANIYYP